MERKYYKTVTKDLKSLGLRKNPNILTFSQEHWTVLDPKNIVLGPEDWGGIWVANTVGNAMKIMKYMCIKYGQDCRIFRVEIGHILYTAGSYRTKTDRVILTGEVFFNHRT